MTQEQKLFSECFKLIMDTISDSDWDYRNGVKAVVKASDGQLYCLTLKADKVEEE